MRTRCLAAGLLLGAVFACTTTAQPRPNVLLYVVDDQGMDDAGCYGHPTMRTPGLDALAAAGTRFSHAFCTTASCSASRSVILTGLHNHSNGQYGHAHAFHKFTTVATVESLPVRLERVGYRTMSVGKFHVAPEEVYRFQQRGKGGAPDQMAATCRELLGAEDQRPFFLYFCTTEPHRPFRGGGSDAVDPADVTVPSYLPDTPECREELARYCMSVQRADRGLLRLTEILKETGHWDDTLVIYVSDNGIAFPGAKTTLYEPGMRLPCVVRDPTQAHHGVVSDAMITWVDLTPTILDFAGALEDPETLHGRSFRAALGREHVEGRDRVFASHTFHEITMYYPMRVVRERRYKLIWNLASGLEYPFASDLWASATWQGVRERGDTVYGKRSVAAYLRRPAFELYDLETDPDEVKNLAAEPAHAARLLAMKNTLRQFQERTKDPWRVKWKHE